MPTPPDSTTNIAAELPEEVLAFLVRAAPRTELWKWLGEKERRELKHDLTRGFQNTINALRQPVVRSRLTHHLQNEATVFQQVLELWTQSTPPPAALTDVRQIEDDAALIEQLPELGRKHGLEAMILSLLVEEREAALDALDGVAEQMAEPPDDKPEESAPPETESESEPQPEQVAQLKAERDEWRERAAQVAGELEKARQSATSARTQSQAEKRELQRQIKQEAKRAETAEAEREDARKMLDRTTRRYKSAHRETDDLTAENKRMKRQLRRQQELSEELRKQIASLTAKLEAAQQNATPKTKPKAESARKKETQSTPAPPTPVVSPLDQIFVWRSDGRSFKTTPREVKRAIDRNDEEFVFSIIQAFDTLRAVDENGYRLFLDRLREFDRYYARVLNTDTTRVLVDASNIARFETDQHGRGQLRHLLAMRAELRRRDCFPITIIADASLPYNIDEPAELQKLIKSGEVQITRSGQEADEILAREARRTGAYVVTNDKTFHHKVSPDFEPLRITFRIYDGMLIVDEF